MNKTYFLLLLLGSSFAFGMEQAIELSDLSEVKRTDEVIVSIDERIKPIDAFIKDLGYDNEEESQKILVTTILEKLSVPTYNNLVSVVQENPKETIEWKWTELSRRAMPAVLKSEAKCQKTLTQEKEKYNRTRTAFLDSRKQLGRMAICGMVGWAGAIIMAILFTSCPPR